MSERVLLRQVTGEQREKGARAGSPILGKGKDLSSRDHFWLGPASAAVIPAPCWKVFTGCVETASLQAFPSCWGTPQPVLCRAAPGAAFSLGDARRNQSPFWGEVLGSRPLCAPHLRPRPVSLAAPEPTVEEKLQKLHSEIKFALKVDNPVSA